MVIGLALAMLLDRKLVGRNLVRSAIFAPFVISGAAIGVAFQFVFDPNFGLIRISCTVSDSNRPTSIRIPTGRCSW